MIIIGLYRLREKAYMARAPGGPHELLAAGEEVRFAGVPPPHLEAVDATAKAAAEMAPPAPPDPIRSLPLSTPVLPGGAPDPDAPPPAPAAPAIPEPAYVDEHGVPLKGIALTNAKRAYTKALKEAADKATEGGEFDNV